jgi:hypothetical protein
MEKNEILKIAQDNKDKIGEMERKKVSKANWIAVISTGVLAVIFMFSEGFQGHRTVVYAFAALCFAWASVFYFCQYFVAKRPWQVLIGATLEAIGAITMITLYILFSVGVL